MKLRKPNKQTILSLLYPPLWVVVLLTIASAALLVFVFVKGYEAHLIAYPIYVLSFYTLVTVVMRLINTVPKHYRLAKTRLYSNPLGERFMTDMPFRTHVMLYGSLCVNLMYVAVNVLLGFTNNTAWFFVLAFYYTILAVMRFLLLRFVNRIGIGKDRYSELRRSRLCGYILLTINLSLSGAVLMILYQNKGYDYSGILIYIMAAYTFFITSMAIKNLIKYRRLGSPVMSMSKIISMAAALVSMLSLETAMFSQFGQDMSTAHQRIFIALTGAGVSIIIVTMSIYSICKNTREINKITEKKAYEE